MDALHTTLGPDLRLFALMSLAGDVRHGNPRPPRETRRIDLLRRLRAAVREAQTAPAEPFVPVLRDYPFARS